MVTIALRVCDSCVFYNKDDNTCKAYPEGIPLKPGDTHFTPRSDQDNDVVYEQDPDLKFWWDEYLLMYPDIEVPDPFKEENLGPGPNRSAT